MTRDEEVEGIIVALDELLRALWAASEAARGDFKVATSAQEAIAAFALPRSASEARAASLMRDPVGRAVRNAITELGERLHELGGMSLMGQALDRVVEMDPATEDWRENVLDKRFSGIGDWTA